MNYLIGLDVGTTGAKALLVDAQGVVCAQVTEPYPTMMPHPLWAEQEPEAWWQASASAIRLLLQKSGVRGEQIIGVGLTGQMVGLVALDRAGNPIRPCIMWNDQRSGPQCQSIHERFGLDQLLELTANPVLPGFLAPKLLWMREQEPENYQRIDHILLPKDYIRLRLTGDYATDVTDAAGTTLFDVRHRRWSPEMADALEIPFGWLPRCVESIEVTGMIHAQAAESTGLCVGTPVVGGAGDQPAQAVGSGIVEPGLVSVTSGTSGVIFAVTDGLAVHPQGALHSFSHALPEMWYMMGVMLSAGGSLRWYRDTLGQMEQAVGPVMGQDAYELLTAQAGQASPGSDGLLFLPYLTGERMPYADPYARGGWIGLTARHDRRHLVRSVLEGVTFGLRDSLELMRGLGLSVLQIRASGGGARSALWRQIQADILGASLVTVNEMEGAAYGAAILAAVGAGVFDSVQSACQQLIRVESQIEPVPAHVERYDELYAIYRQLYGTLKEHNDHLSAFAMKTQPA